MSMTSLRMQAVIATRGFLPTARSLSDPVPALPDRRMGIFEVASCGSAFW
jgi:hypothetical protein